MNFYVASSFKNKDQVRNLSSRLKLEGFYHTFDWTQNERSASLEALSTIGEEEKEAIIQSDFLVIILPAGKGSHVELGIALGLGKRIYLFSPTNEIYEYKKTTTFYHVQGVDSFVGSLDAFIAYVIKVENKLR